MRRSNPAVDGSSGRRRHRGPYREMAFNFLVDLFCLRARYRRFRPLITNFYVTKQCNLRCRYCYPPGEEPEVGLEEALLLLQKIRPHNPALNITGGEPLLYEPIREVINAAGELRFYPVILSTNGLLIDRIIDQLHLVNHVIISLDSLSEEVNEQIRGVTGSTTTVLDNIERCRALSREKGFRFSLHSVISPESIDSIEEIVEFCSVIGATLSVSPEHGRYLPNRELVNNERYVRLIDRLIELKGQGKPVFCSVNYLQQIRDFSPHRCYPFISPRVEPDGRVYLPCQRIGSRHVYLQDYRNLYELMRQEASWLASPDCSERCFLACYLEVERYIRDPLSLLKESAIRPLLIGRNRTPTPS
ncbi:radical SAM protein [Gemmatimonadota bacterium]